MRQGQFENKGPRLLEVSHFETVFVVHATQRTVNDERVSKIRYYGEIVARMKHRAPWNRNIHYHDAVLEVVPQGCRLALDVGCGQGFLSRRLAQHCEQVFAIDHDTDVLARAVASTPSMARITYMQGDVMTYPLPEGSFDLVTAVAALHHLPLRPALVRFKSLLKRGGVLAVVGLYRNKTPRDYALSAAAIPVSAFLRLRYGLTHVAAPLQDPVETLSEIRSACEELLPGSRIRQRLLFRYSLIWQKP